MNVCVGGWVDCLHVRGPVPQKWHDCTVICAVKHGHPNCHRCTVCTLAKWLPLHAPWPKMILKTLSFSVQIELSTIVGKTNPCDGLFRVFATEFFSLLGFNNSYACWITGSPEHCLRSANKCYVGLLHNRLGCMAYAYVECPTLRMVSVWIQLRPSSKTILKTPIYICSIQPSCIQNDHSLVTLSVYVRMYTYVCTYIHLLYVIFYVYGISLL
jgi:hypothetical protein